MGRLTKRQQKQIHYFLRQKSQIDRKQKMLHEDGVPKFLEKHMPYIRKLARNLDQILIVGSFISPPLKTGLLDRFLVLSEIEGIEPIVCLNKIDLLEDGKEGTDIFSIYQKIGYQTVLTSAKTGQGVQELAAMMRGKRSALAGHSGVGKSSLLNAIDPNLQIEVNEVSDVSKRGRHTTSQVKIYHLTEATEVIDLPGIKEIDFIDIHPREARYYFREFDEFAPYCKFSNCLHISERDCAVKEALKEGQIHPGRYESYLNFVKSLEH